LNEDLVQEAANAGAVISYCVPRALVHHRVELCDDNRVCSSRHDSSTLAARFDDHWNIVRCGATKTGYEFSPSGVDCHLPRPNGIVPAVMLARISRTNRQVWS